MLLPLQGVLLFSICHADKPAHFVNKIQRQIEQIVILTHIERGKSHRQLRGVLLTIIRQTLCCHILVSLHFYRNDFAINL